MVNIRNMSIYALVLICAFLQPTITNGRDDVVVFGCENREASAEFNNSKAKIFNQLQTAFPSTPYSIVTSTLGNNVPNTAYGVAQCTNMPHQECKSCISQAVEKLKQECATKAEGKAWFPKCFFHFSDQLFFGQVDHNDDDYRAEGPMAKDKPKFAKVIRDMVKRLAAKATQQPITNMYSQEIIRYDNRQLHGMVMCTIDLSPENCKACLDVHAEQLSFRTDDAENVRLSSSSCMLRYGFYNFF